jgi:photosystem II stability/assembly factor-like uncharacterized protein
MSSSLSEEVSMKVGALILSSVILAAASAAGGFAASTIDPDLFAGMKARSIGPAGMSGRVAAIDAVESNPDIVYVGAATGGVWKSTNGGLTFRPIFDKQPVHAIGAISVNQRNPAIVWVGTGEGNVRNSTSIGNGIYKSVDGGETWAHLGLEGSERIHRIVLHPTDADVAWVAALGPLWGDGTERGLFKTTDGGKSWRKVLSIDARTGAADVAIDPRNPDKLYASLWQFRRWPFKFESGGPGSGLYVSSDGGESWKKLQPEDGLPEGELGRIGLAVSRSNPDTVYAMVEAKKSALLRSDDGGKSWRTVNSEPNVNPRPFYFGEIRVDPSDSNKVYSVDYDIRVSADGGKSFREAIKGREIHGDYHALWIDPAQPLHFYVGNDGGVATTSDGGSNARFVGNLPLAQFYHVAYDMDTPYNLYGGLQDNGAWRGPSSVWQGGGIRNYMWKVLVFGDGFETLPDPENSHRGYSLWQGGNIDRWDIDKGEYKDVKPAPPADGPALRFNWNAGLAQDPFEPGTIYLGSQFLHKSTDHGETWTTISPDLTSNNPEWQKAGESGGITPDVTNAENFTTIITIAPSKLERGLIWTGSDDGRVNVTRDGGKTWTRVDANVRGVPADTWVPAIEPSPRSAGTAFVVFDNHRRSDFGTYLVRTDDYGKTWRSVATSDLRGYALTIVQDPVDPELLFAGTEFGLWVSFDGAKKWFPWRQGVATASVMDLAIHPRENDLIIATHGRALYVLDDIRPLRDVTPEVMAAKLHLFPVADAALIRTLGQDGGYGAGAGEFRGENRAEGALVTFVVNGDDLPLPDADRERARKETERQAKKAEEARKAEEGKKAAAAKPGAKPEVKAETPKEETKDDFATVEVRDGSSALVRTLRPKVTQGLNRIAWELDRDAFRAIPSDEPPEADATPGGPSVPPGSYELTVKFRGESSKTSVRVLADPRSKNSDDDWQARWKAVQEIGSLRDTLVLAIERIRSTRKDIDAVEARVREANADRLLRHEVKGDELPLVKDGKTLKEGLAKIEKTLWQAPDTVGIVPEDDVLSRLYYVQGYLGSSWDRPNPTHLEYLRQARGILGKSIDELNRFFAADVATYRKKVEESGPKLLPAVEPLELP